MISDWLKITEKTTNMLLEKGISIEFNDPAKDDRYVKSKPTVPGIFWTFAKTKDDLWVELEIKPKKGSPQKDLYESLKKRQSFLHKECGCHFIWDEADRRGTNKNSARNIFRIKSYISSYRGSVRAIEKECIDRMVKFILSFHTAPD